MPKLSGNAKPSFRAQQVFRLLVIPCSLLLLVGLFSLKDGGLLSRLLGIQEIQSTNDFDGDGVLDNEDIDDDNDGILDIDEGCIGCQQDTFVNGDFEEGPFPRRYTQTNEDNVNGWETTAPDNKIEIWKTGFLSVPSQSGSYHVEINSSHDAALYQSFCARPGAQLSWSVWHRGRAGTDVAVVKMGRNVGTATPQLTMTTGNTAWVQYTGTYTVPPGQTTTYFICEAISTANGSPSVGNFIDNIVVTEILAGTCQDSDRDGMADHIDLDSDNDGLLDIVEAGGTDSNGDGMADDATDTDGDGLVDIFDNDNSDGPIVSGCMPGDDCDLSGSTSSLFDTSGDEAYEEDADLDGDGKPNYQDIDADGDGIVDNIEGQRSSGYKSPVGYDDDQDGIDNAYDRDCTGACTDSDGTTLGVTGVVVVAVNTDGTDNPDYLDRDADDDGASDMNEAYDTNGDGQANVTPNGSDSDGDGLDDAFDSNDLGSDARNNATNTGQTAGNFPDDDQSGGEPDWRDTGISFPVEWLSFDVIQSGSHATLEWATATETNSSHFEIERSEDGRTFETIGEEPAMGHSQDIHHYQFVDREAATQRGTRLSYRLRQVDLDGAFSYSRIEELAFQGADPVVEIVLAPNPATAWVTLQYTRPGTGPLPFAMFSTTGREVYRGIIPDQQGELSVDVSTWPRGTYVVRVANQQQRVAKLLVR